MTDEIFLQQLPELVKNYQPSSAVVEHINTTTLLMIIGPSAVGKSTLIKKLGLPFVPSDTTRKPRPGEVDGVDFHFLTEEKKVIADIKAGRFVQVAIGPSGDFYATSASSYPKSGIAVMPVVADVVPIFRNLGFKNTVSAFISPQSYEEWMHRIKKRGFDAKEVTKRFPEAKRSLSFALNDSQVHFILNDDIDKAAAQVKDLLNGIEDTEREKTARQAAKGILHRLS